MATKTIIEIDAQVLAGLRQAFGEAERSVKSLSTTARQASDDQKRALADIRSGLDAMSRAATVASTAVVGGFAAIGVAAIKASSDMTANRIAFETMLGSAQKARQFLEEAQRFADQTPFDLPDVLEGAKRLKAFGAETDRIIPIMRTLGDTAAVFGRETLPRIINALGQMGTAGRVNAQDMLQLTSVGIPAWEILAQKFGVTTEKLRELSEKGAIPARQAIEALLTGLQERFGGGMEKLANEIPVQFSNLKGEVLRSLVSIGDAIKGDVIDVIGQLRQRIVELRESGQLEEFFRQLAPAVKSVADALIDLIPRVTDLLKWFNSLSPETKTFALEVTALAGGFLILAPRILATAEALVKLSAGLRVASAASLTLGGLAGVSAIGGLGVVAGAQGVLSGAIPPGSLAGQMFFPGGAAGLLPPGPAQPIPGTNIVPLSIEEIAASHMGPPPPPGLVAPPGGGGSRFLLPPAVDKAAARRAAADAARARAELISAFRGRFGADLPLPPLSQIPAMLARSDELDRIIEGRQRAAAEAERFEMRDFSPGEIMGMLSGLRAEPGIEFHAPSAMAQFAPGAFGFPQLPSLPVGDAMSKMAEAARALSEEMLNAQIETRQRLQAEAEMRAALLEKQRRAEEQAAQQEQETAVELASLEARRVESAKHGEIELAKLRGASAQELFNLNRQLEEATIRRMEAERSALQVQIEERRLRGEDVRLEEAKLRAAQSAIDIRRAALEIRPTFIADTIGRGLDDAAQRFKDGLADAIAGGGRSMRDVFKAAIFDIKRTLARALIESFIGNIFGGGGAQASGIADSGVASIIPQIIGAGPLVGFPGTPGEDSEAPIAGGASLATIGFQVGGPIGAAAGFLAGLLFDEPTNDAQARRSGRDFAKHFLAGLSDENRLTASLNDPFARAVTGAGGAQQGRLVPINLTINVSVGGEELESVLVRQMRPL